MKTVLAALGMAAIASASQAGAQKMNDVQQQVQQQVQVQSKAGKVLVTLSVANGTGKPVHVPKAVFEDDELFGRAFDIIHVGTGAVVDYIGPMVKRGPLTKDDYLAVQAGGKHANVIDITRSYAFKPGKHDYQLTFAGNWLGNVAKLDAASTATVAPVKFSHTGK